MQSDKSSLSMSPMSLRDDDVSAGFTLKISDKPCPHPHCAVSIQVGEYLVAIGQLQQVMDKGRRKGGVSGSSSLPPIPGPISGGKG